MGVEGNQEWVSGCVANVRPMDPVTKLGRPCVGRRALVGIMDVCDITWCINGADGFHYDVKPADE